jgi:hypothetical protein
MSASRASPGAPSLASATLVAKPWLFRSSRSAAVRRAAVLQGESPARRPSHVAGTMEFDGIRMVWGVFDGVDEISCMVPSFPDPFSGHCCPLLSSTLSTSRGIASHLGQALQ